MQTKVQRQLAAAKRRIERLDKSKLGDCSRPVFAIGNIHYEMAERTRGMTYGGLGAIVLLVRRLGLAEAIDRRWRRCCRRSTSMECGRRAPPLHTPACRRFGRFPLLGPRRVKGFLR